MVKNSTLNSANTTITLANILNGITLEANSTYDITAVAVLTVVGNGAGVGSRVAFVGDGTIIFNYTSIDEMSFTSTTPTPTTYCGIPNNTTFITNSTTILGTGTHYYRRRLTLRTGGTGGVLNFQHAVAAAGGTTPINSSTPATGSFIFARKVT